MLRPNGRQVKLIKCSELHPRRIAQQFDEAGIAGSAPHYPEYVPDYYAIFFNDPVASGSKSRTAAKNTVDASWKYGRDGAL